MTNARYVYSELASAIQARQNCSAINHPFTTAIGWITTGIMVIAGLATIYALFL